MTTRGFHDHLQKLHQTLRMSRSVPDLPTVLPYPSSISTTASDVTKPANELTDAIATKIIKYMAETHDYGEGELCTWHLSTLDISSEMEINQEKSLFFSVLDSLILNGKIVELDYEISQDNSIDASVRERSFIALRIQDDKDKCKGKSAILYE